MRRFAGVVAVLVGVGASVLCANAAFARGDKHAAIAMDANTGVILHNDDGDEQRHPASLTKMMTLYLTFETIEQGRMTMGSAVKISEDAANVAPSKLDLEPGDEISVRDAILALITKSANDVAVALAEKIGGTEANFVRLMNAKAKALGMTKTNFENPNGLPDSSQVTSARDMITLGMRLQDDFPQHYRLFATRVFSYHGRSYRNHNTLMNHFSGIDGIKTGYTQASGFNLVSSVRRNGRHVVAAVFGGRSAAARNAEMANLLNRALSRASPTKTRKPAPALIAKLKAEPKLAERPPKKPSPQIVAEAKPLAKPAPPRPEFVPEAPTRGAAPEALPNDQDARPVMVSEPVTDETPAGEIAQAPNGEPQPTPAASAVPKAAPSPIALAKVRRVVVAPRQGPPRPKPSETTDMASQEPMPDPAVAETIIPKVANAATQVAAATPPSPASMLGARDVVPEPTTEAALAQNEAKPVAVQPRAAALATASTSTKPAASSQSQPKKDVAKSATPTTPGSGRVSPPVQRGSTPSTFEAQASALKGAAGPQRIAALTPPQGSAPPVNSGRFEIQIGAYASVNEAQRAISSAQARTGTLLASYPSVTQPVNKGGRQIFRARFRGFDASTATTTCQKLRQNSLDCFVMTAE